VIRHLHKLRSDALAGVENHIHRCSSLRPMIVLQKAAKFEFLGCNIKNGVVCKFCRLQNYCNVRKTVAFDPLEELYIKETDEP